MTLVDMTALDEQFHTQFISQHWVTCLCTGKFLTYTQCLTSSTYHTFMPTGSHTLFRSLSLSCSPVACQAVTGLQSPLPSCKHYFTRSTRLFFSTFILYLYSDFLTHNQNFSQTMSSLWLQLPLSHMISHTHTHSSPVSFSYLVTNLQSLLLFLTHTIILSLSQSISRPHHLSHTVMPVILS